ncbi:MAG: Lrp/AsnC family transcriptional regulator [Candidatus Thorarchaeota archaeon]|nr:Lrp/AsnC family transcriptional regulator [Candidatus Thorarchaeota archaeon]
MTEEPSASRLDAKIDDTDIQILRLLQRDGRMSLADIAKEIDKGVSTIHARMRRLKTEGVIKQYTAVVDPTKLGRTTLGIILVTVRYRAPGQRGVLSQREFCEEIAKHPLVQEVHVLSGEFDVLLKVRTKDVSEMNQFIVDFLREIPAVERTLTMFALDTYLDTLELRNLRP